MFHNTMHRLGLIDDKLSNETRFKWLKEVEEICHQLFKMCNWGKHLARLSKASEDLEAQYLQWCHRLPLH